MRWAKSYSIIDHNFFHEGYFHRLNHQALALYLFLVVVGDREGKSFYGESTIMKILKLKSEDLKKARIQLVKEKLIRYEAPHWWLQDIEPVRTAFCQKQVAKVRRELSVAENREKIQELIQQISRRKNA